MPLEAGTKLGPYEVTAPIGAGGMGELFYQPDFEEYVSSGHAEIRSVRIDTEPEFAVSDARTISPGRFVFGPRAREWDIAPDGETLVMVFPASSTGEHERIHIVLNWFEELKAKVPVN